MKVAYVYTYDFAVWRFRRGLIQELIRTGHEVAVICPEGDYTERIKELGVNFIPIHVDRLINPFADMRFLFSLYRIFRREKFDLVHNFTIKPNTYGAISARFAGVKRRVALVAGLGYAFGESYGPKAFLIKTIALLFYRIGFKYTDKVWFQNPEDLDYFVNKGILSPSKAVLIKGSGVDIQEFAISAVSQGRIKTVRRELGITEDMKVIIMPARATRSKGVLEYIEASDMVAEQYPKVVFLLMGVPADGDPGSLTVEFLNSVRNSRFKWLGFRQDAKEIIAMSDVVVLPSYYREGVPRSLLEALSLGKPIVTTDNVGCRETVEDGKNGFLVPIKNASAISEAVLAILRDDTLRQSFGKYSRLKAEKEFSEQGVIERVFTELYGFKSLVKSSHWL